MKFVLFYHSVTSDWNHGNAHFLRGVATELIARGHCVEIHEPANGWSSSRLREEQGCEALEAFALAYPQLTSHSYTPERLDLEHALDGADVVIVHEWNPPELVRRIGACASRQRCRLFFHDTHHRSVSEPDAIAALDLRHYDGVLAFGRTVADRYVHMGWANGAWVWHEAADIRRFRPMSGEPPVGDLVWVGNWGDDERSAQLHEFLIDPARQLRLRARVYGVRYPQEALHALQAAGIEYGGWLANHRVPEIFARYGCTVHVPRRAYCEALQGVPTIRMFEALACGIPLISAPWNDAEKLFRPGIDYLIASSGAQMREHLRDVLSDADFASGLVQHGLQTIRERHTCAHRIDELLRILEQLQAPSQSVRFPTPLSEGA